MQFSLRRSQSALPANMALRTLAGRWRAGAAVAAAIAAGGTVAYCEDPKGVGFDPEALERGAKALREINKSPYAKKVCLPSCCTISRTRSGVPTAVQYVL